jgi:hypothetical protein
LDGYWIVSRTGCELTERQKQRTQFALASANYSMTRPHRQNLERCRKAGIKQVTSPDFGFIFVG